MNKRTCHDTHNHYSLLLTIISSIYGLLSVYQLTVHQPDSLQRGGTITLWPQARACWVRGLRWIKGWDVLMVGWCGSEYHGVVFNSRCQPRVNPSSRPSSSSFPLFHSFHFPSCLYHSCFLFLHPHVSIWCCWHTQCSLIIHLAPHMSLIITNIYTCIPFLVSQCSLCHK